MHRYELLDAAPDGALADSWIDTWEELVAAGVPAPWIETPSTEEWSHGLRVLGTPVLLLADGTWLRSGPHGNSVAHGSVASLLTYRDGSGESLRGRIRRKEAQRADAVVRAIGGGDAAATRGWLPVGKEPIACGRLGEAVVVRGRGGVVSVHGRAWSHYVDDEPSGLLTPWTQLHSWPASRSEEVEREARDAAHRAARRMAGRPQDRLVGLADLPGHMGFEAGAAPSVDTLRRAITRAGEDGPRALDTSAGGQRLYHPLLVRAWWDGRPGHGPGRPRRTSE